MRIAYIVMCHKSIPQINRLINALSDENSHFYVHVDGKSDINAEELLGKNIFVLPKEESVSVSWGGINMVKATLKMIETVLNSGQKYDYVWLISGQDFPIKSVSEIQEFFKQNKDMNFIELIDKDSEVYKRYLKRNSLYYPEWMLKDKFIIKVLKRLYVELTGGYYQTFRIFRRKQKLDFHYGSQWWALTYKCVKYINKFCQKNPYVLKAFEYTLCPDECFFQTIFKISPYSEHRRGCLVYVDWSQKKRSPKILTIRDFEKLIQAPNFLQARKFDISVDSDVIDKIERYIM